MFGESFAGVAIFLGPLKESQIPIALCLEDLSLCPILPIVLMEDKPAL